MENNSQWKCAHVHVQAHEQAPRRIWAWAGRARVSACDYTIFLANKCSIFAESKANDISIRSITITSFVLGVTVVAIRNHI